MNPKYEPHKRWQAKVGLISKSYKLNKEVVEAFSNACEIMNISQAKQLTNMMDNFIKEAEKVKEAQENNTEEQ